MNTGDAIAARRSIRAFLPEEPEKERISALLEAARQAPSAKNKQHWFFVVVHGEAKDEIARLTLEKGESDTRPDSSVSASARAMAQAPYLILVYQRVTSPYLRSDILSIGACVENICLKAVEEGLGTLWICDICDAQSEINAYLGKDMPLIAAVAVGYAAEAPKARRREPMEAVAEWIGGERDE